MDQSNWINEIFKKRPNGFDPYVEKHFYTDEGLQYGSWNKYQGQKQIDERSIFPNEIVIDIDAETTEKARKENRKVTTFLDSKGYDYILADTGGTGFHIHLFFEYKGLEKEEYREYRIALYEYLRAKCEEEANVDTTLWDDQTVKFDISNSKGHLVRAIGGRKKDTEKRKTQVVGQPKKQDIEKIEDVEYPETVPWSIKISKTGTDKSDLSINKINDKVEEVKKQEEEKHEAEIETDYQEKISGLEDVRDIPASKALELVGADFKQKQNFECPFHADSNPSANLHTKDGVERLYCFSNSCAEDSRVKVSNAVDILIESGYNFSESVEKLSNKFDIEVQIGYNPIDYFGNNVKGNFVVRPDTIVDEIMDEYLFKNVIDGGFYVWKDGYWQELSSDNDIIGREVDKRLRNETSSRHRSNVKEIIKNKESVKVEKEDFENPEMMIPFKNGLYDLENDELVENKPEYNFDFKYNVEYKPGLDDDSVQRFIETLMPESKDKQQKLREVAALSLAPWKINQKVPVFYGQGSNGKNQFVKIVRKMIGNSCFHKTSAYALQNDNFEMASVVNKQMAFFDEFEDVTKPGQLKTLVGDEQQKVREMRKESYTTKTSVYPIFAANELPNPKDNSDGFYRRWEIIDFNQKFTSAKNDGNPDKLPPKKLEEMYMSEEALNAFATSLIKDLKELIERKELTNQQRIDETRQIWKKKGNALYAFIDKYLTQGDLPDENSGSTDDWIKKDELMEIINSYMDYNNNSQIKKHRLTKALDNHPDFRIWKTYRPEANDGSRPTAYAGIKFDDDHVQDVKLFLGFNAYASPPLNNINELGKWYDIVDTNIVAKTLAYLTRSEKDQVTLFELVRNLDLKEGHVPKINTCDFVKKSSEMLKGGGYPVYEIDVEAVRDAGYDIDVDSGKVRKTSSFVKARIDSWSSDTHIDEQEFIEKVSEEGFNESNVEDVLERLKSEGEIFEPKPGKIKKM